MKSQNGIGLVTLVLIIIVLMLLTGVATYVVVQDGGVADQVITNTQNNSQTVNSSNEVNSSVVE